MLDEEHSQSRRMPRKQQQKGAAPRGRAAGREEEARLCGVGWACACVG